MPHDGSEPGRVAFARIAEVNFMVKTAVAEIRDAALREGKRIHRADRCRLIIVRADVHALDRETFRVREEFHG